MELQKQVHIYNVKTNAFYTEHEQFLDQKMWLFRQNKKRIQDTYETQLALYLEKRERFKTRQINKLLKQEGKAIKRVKRVINGKTYMRPTMYHLTVQEKAFYTQLFKDVWWDKNKSEIYGRINRNIKIAKQELKQEIERNKYKTRIISERYLNPRNVISIFDSMLTRYCGIENDTLSDKLIIVRVYYFGVLESLIKNGFYRDVYDESGNFIERIKYVPYSSSAGQIRTKKFVMIREDVLKAIQMQLMVGLTVDKINNHQTEKGINVNKYLAYLSLNNSATEVWYDFDIDKCIVVDDMETMVRGVVDEINISDFTMRHIMKDVPVPHTDGWGMVLYPKYRKNFMVRMGWIKGLLTPFDFVAFIKMCNDKDPSVNHAIVKDIYGKEYDIVNDKIEVILTKSQFKMWKYYKTWYEYKYYFKKFGCQASYCNEEPNRIKTSTVTYQMLQSLTDITQDEIEALAEDTNNEIKDIGTKQETMLKILGVTEFNQNKNYLQQALEIYPEMLQDSYIKEIIKNVKRKRIKEAKAGKLNLGGKYAFQIPDPYAFCEWLFGKDDNPSGLLMDGEVYCNMFKNGAYLDCLRSPHLYKEHAIRRNKTNVSMKKWFVTKGCYISVHDLITKILMSDCDGDKLLLIPNKKLVQVAKRNMKGIVPLYYDMKKALPVRLNEDSIYDGLVKAFTGGSIGEFSNTITKVYNSKDCDLDVVKILCCLNNFKIDEAKTLFMPIVPKNISERINKYRSRKLPHFFVYAKDKDKKSVSKHNDGIVDVLDSVIKKTPIRFDYKQIDRFKYEMLMNNPNVEMSHSVMCLFDRLNQERCFDIKWDDDKNNLRYLYSDMRNEMLKYVPDDILLCDILVKGLYSTQAIMKKQTLWEMFGDVLLNNLKSNIEKHYPKKTCLCIGCGRRITFGKNAFQYCPSCKQKYKKTK